MRHSGRSFWAVWCVPDRCAIKMQTVEIAGMVKEGSAGRVRVWIKGGCLRQAEQRALEEGLPGVVLNLLGLPFKTFKGGCTTQMIGKSHSETA